MKHFTLRRAVSSVAAVALVGVGVAVTAAPASAATIANLTLSPATGPGLSITSFNTPGQCASGDSLVLKVSGGNLAAAKNLNGAVGADSYFNGTGMTIGASQTWSSFASSAGLSQLVGTYTVSAVCSAGDTFTGQLTFAGTGTGAGALYVAVTPTTTSVAPITDSVYGTPTTFTATVESSGILPVGTVEFFSGATSLGSSSTFVAAGATAFSASLAGVSLSAGATPKSITAVFTPSGAATGAAAGLTSSTSAAQTYTVSKASPAVSLQIVTNPAAQGGSTVLNATVTTGGSNGPAGSVTFFANQGGAGDVAINTAAVNTTTGVATTTWSIPFAQPAGADYVLKAVFTPTDTTNYVAGAFSTGAFEVTGKQSIGNAETIQVTVPAGTLTATIPSQQTVTLNFDGISTDGTHFLASGNLRTVKVQDTRAGDFGWYANIEAVDFVACSSYATTGTGKSYFSPANAVDNPTVTQVLSVPACASATPLAATSEAWQKTTINRYNLGVAAALNPDTANGRTLNPNGGATVASPWAADNKLPGVSGSGIGESRRIVTLQGGLGTGSGTGTFLIDGALSLNIPTVNVAGSYASTVTITVI